LEQLPNWIAAIATVLALGAAIFAGVWARQAAIHTEAQADAAKEQTRFAEQQVVIARQELAQAADQFDRQLTVAREELELTSGEAERQRQEAVRANRRAKESRLDALAPAIFGLAKLREAVTASDYPIRAFIEFRSPSDPDWMPVPIKTWPLESDYPSVTFRLTVHMKIHNVSDKVAVVLAEKYPAHGEVDRTEFAVVPSEETTVTWTRLFQLDDLRNYAEPDPMFDLSFSVWDVSHAVEDVYLFWAGLLF